MGNWKIQYNTAVMIQQSREVIVNTVTTENKGQQSRWRYEEEGQKSLLALRHRKPHKCTDDDTHVRLQPQKLHKHKQIGLLLRLPSPQSRSCCFSCHDFLVMMD